MHQSSGMRSTTLGYRTVESIKYVVLTAVETCADLEWCIRSPEREKDNDKCPGCGQNVIDFILLFLEM